MIWRCPACRGSLTRGEVDGAVCGSCGARYESVAEILDLRLPGPSWIDIEQDRAAARSLAEVSVGWTAEEMVRHVFRSQPGRTEAAIVNRTRQVMESPDRLRSECRDWLRPILDGELFLDLGCGPGALLAAAEGSTGIGIDVSMVWLVVARRLISERGGTPVLAAARAETLPLADGAVSGVVSLDVIEHVADPGQYLREINRITRTGGSIALSTPNRYSLTAEPHVGVWGVGWLPRRLQAPYVKWRSNKSYDYCRLLSIRELTGLMRRHTRFRAKIILPPIPQNEIDTFPPLRARLAGWYNRLVSRRWLSPLFRWVCPFFRVLGKKRSYKEHAASAATKSSVRPDG